MIIKLDIRESSLIHQILHLKNTTNSFEEFKIETETLPIGDIIINDGVKDLIIIERKSMIDLISSIKDGRYEEQSFRLNGLEIHNHNIYYLIEGDIGKNCYHSKKYNCNPNLDKTIAYSAMFSLSYYKGFSVMRSFSLEDTAFIICNMAYKLQKELKNKTPFYSSKISNIENINNIKDNLDDDNKNGEEIAGENINITINENENIIKEKEYVSVIKKVKKDNITLANIGEIMLCQIPGVSAIYAIAIMSKYKTIENLIGCLRENKDCLKDFIYENSVGQTRKISKTVLENIIKYLIIE